MKQGILKANALKIGSLEADFMNPPSGFMSAKAAFVDMKTGHTHGWTTHQIWSPTTLLKLRELRDAMEADLASAHFIGGDADSPAGTGDIFAPPQQQADLNRPKGLGEHLDSEREDADPF